MKIKRFISKVAIALISVTLSVSAFAHGAKVTPLMKEALSGLPDKEGTMLIVEYAPGMSSEKHRHDAHIFAYVLEGAVTMQVEGSEPVTLKVGDSFYESPDDIHLISKNASTIERARMVVFSLSAKNAPIVIPVK